MTVHGQIVGLAHGRGDVAEFLRRAGVADPAHAVSLDDPRLIEWRGGSLDDWPMPPA
ncbi:hypothetical protein K530_52355 [Streptomyces noursei CCRC 11814]|uniref:Uncharacterized protein n=1 Tax=Streptomyces noursei TaxID=1971 RepID=A0A059WIW5_STRNR|nr:hypothetical protein DC74_7317 [Streptomyces noursei]EPY92617.1 hypothetical protein K530_52355 [Streptomyces noursei CCRC 11814]GCB95478.1 hypothetical protein SALB_08283 [Streptomyces noursei]